MTATFVVLCSFVQSHDTIPILTARNADFTNNKQREQPSKGIDFLPLLFQHLFVRADLSGRAGYETFFLVWAMPFTLATNFSRDV